MTEALTDDCASPKGAMVTDTGWGPGIAKAADRLHWIWVGVTEVTKQLALPTETAVLPMLAFAKVPETVTTAVTAAPSLEKEMLAGLTAETVERPTEEYRKVQFAGDEHEEGMPLT